MKYRYGKFPTVDISEEAGDLSPDFTYNENGFRFREHTVINFGSDLRNRLGIPANPKVFGNYPREASKDAPYI